MLSDIRDKIKKLFEYGFQDLTAIGEAKSVVPGFLTADQLMRMNPDRYRFYMQLSAAMLSGNPNVVYRSLGIHRMNEHQRSEIREHLADLEKYLSAYRSTEKELENEMKSGITSQAGGGNHWEELVKKVTDFNENKAAVPADSDAAVEKLKLLENERSNPLFSPDILKATVTDRIIFIAITFAIRSFSLTFLDWALSNRMVNSVESAIGFYVGMYVLMFLLLALVVNLQEKGTLLPIMFFYISTHAPRGGIRIGLHVALQLMLLPIPFILRVAKSSTTQYLSFEDRRRSLRLVGNLSFIIWALTSFIALRAT